MGAMATYVRAGLPEVATALAALTGEPHPLAIKDPGAGRAANAGFAAPRSAVQRARASSSASTAVPAPSSALSFP